MNKEVNIIDGKVIYNSKEYCFHYDDNLITLYPEKLEDKWKSFREMFLDVNSKDYIKGIFGDVLELTKDKKAMEVILKARKFSEMFR